MNAIAEWSPVSHDLGLIQLPVADVVRHLTEWHLEHGTRYVRTESLTSLEDAFRSLLPLTNAKTRRLFLPTTAGWTACFQNGIQGSDPFPAMSFLAGRANVLAMRVCIQRSAPYPATIWEVYAPRETRRSLAAVNDGGKWVFHSSGEPYPFEEVPAYSAKRVRDRFTPAMLERYLDAGFGLRPFEDSFYPMTTSPAMLLSQTTNLYPMPEYTLEEVKAGLPWRRS
jgi:hypothetical protein